MLNTWFSFKLRRRLRGFRSPSFVDTLVLAVSMSGRPDPLNNDVFRALIDRSQTMWAMCDSSELVWESFQTLLRRVVREDTDRLMRSRSSQPLPRHPSGSSHEDKSGRSSNALRIRQGSSSVSRSVPAKAIPYRLYRRSRSRSRRRSGDDGLFALGVMS